MGERDDARREVEQKRERMSEIAHEVSRRMTPQYAKERAREMARDRMIRVRESATESSWFAPFLGAGIGALVAKAIQSRAQDRQGHRDWEAERWARGDADRYGRRYGYGEVRAGGEGYWTEPPVTEEWSGEAPFDAGVEGEGRGRMAEAGAKISEKASDVKERAQAATQHVRDRVQGATSAVRERLPGREAIRASAHDDTGMWAFGALALGALFGFALPVSRREREMLEPARRKAAELTEQVKEKALEKGSEAMDRASAKVDELGGSGESARGTTPDVGQGPFPGSPTPLH
jgi:ElaB/YqjD/DUF883 family membrane-anchored ribosome-binding protein